MLADSAWSMSKNKPHQLIRGFSNCPKGTEMAPLHGMLYINFMHKCTMIIYLPLLGFWMFFLSSLLHFPLSLVCTLKLRIIRTVFTWQKYSYGINLASWNFKFCFSPNSRRIHVAIVLRLFFTLRKYISNLQMQRSSFFWSVWYSSLTKVSSKLDNSSWETWRTLKC